jgi:hypothetical protein
MLAACDAHARSRGATGTAPRILRPSVELVVEPNASAEDAMICRLGDLAFDSAGRIFAVDRLEQNIRVYSARGLLMYRIKTLGLDDLVLPCCPVMRSDTLVVNDNGRKRQLFLSVRNDSATLIREDTVRSVPAAKLIPPALPDSVTRYRITRPGKFWSFGKPGAPLILRTIHAEFGVAYAIDTAYVVRWFDAQGNALARLQRLVNRIPYSTQEIASLEAQIANAAVNAGLSRDDLPVRPPEVKPAITNLRFDLDGRLWVFRSVPSGAMDEADVYERNGQLWAVVQWPRSMMMLSAAISGTTGLVLSREASGAERIVRIRLK